jgi:hypothetical protein
MSVLVLIYVMALVFAAVDEIHAQGQSFTAWAVILIAIGLLWGHIGG